MLTITLSPYVLFPALIFILVAFIHILIKNLGHVQIIKYYESSLPFLEDKLKVKDDELDLLFIQLLQWRELSEEYRQLFKGFLTAIGNEAMFEILENLEAKFEHLYDITETDRKKYMSQLRQKSGYTDEFNKAVSHVVEKLVGMNTGMKAEETPVLNSNRDN